MDAKSSRLFALHNLTLVHAREYTEVLIWETYLLLYQEL